MASNATLLVGYDRNTGASGQTNWTPVEDSWNYWWSYSGVSGPTYWGLLNPDWFMCDRGRHQSPVNIETKSLVYDPHLKPLHADNNLISGLLLNDGHAIIFNGSFAAQRLLPALTPNGFVETKALFAPQENQMDSDGKPQANANKSLLGAKLKRDSVGKQTNSESSIENGQRQMNTNEDVDGGLFLMAESLADQDGTSGSTNLMVGNLTRSIELSVRQSNQLESGAILEQMNNDAMIESRVDVAPLDGLPVVASGPGDNISNLDDQQSVTRITFSGAGLAYNYQFETFYLRFGQPSSSNSQAATAGSEHLIDSQAFPAELQILAYNLDLYKSFAEASTKPNGLLGIAILIEALQDSASDTTGSNSNREQQSSFGQTTTSINGASNRTNGSIPNDHLERLIRDHLSSIQHRGSSTIVRGLNLIALLPETSQFVAYSGSLTQPGCHESVDWLILNRPLYISQGSVSS